VQDHAAEIAGCPERIKNEPVFPERLGIRSEFEVKGQQFVGTRPGQHFTAVDPFWGYEIAAPKGHNRRQLADPPN
jgi:hypothetical protein